MGDPLCSLGNFQIPRPKCIGMEFVAIKGTHSGFYRTINKNIAFKYGISQQRTFGVSTRRPSIPKEWTNIKKNNNENEERESSKSNNGSISEENEVVSEPLPDYEVEERKKT
ncbi:hypothetical protein Mgra_00007637 [Meloidogyne graminicola]|uniref:Uncharacterized protein n=1 Tax=Meloidogyne graminicola TaxID=189291 RepID=A0A8S9ZHX1_9BILA|nr:hypothetical protein Mgra_00007637 [Meloidogyne graminicola]